MQKVLLLVTILLVSFGAFAQLDNVMGGSVSGNFKLDAQTYSPDSIIGADTISEKLLSNSYMNIIYTNGNFKAGVRFEGYFNAMEGYEKQYNGFGLASRFATYTGDFVEVTAGNFYEQFGNGLAFRAYEDRDLGYDNAMDGALVKVKPHDGIILKGIIGQQRLYWEKAEGLVRGADAEFAINSIIGGFAESNHRITLGGSFVSKFQKDEDPTLILPENVAIGAGRINYSISGFNITSEYAYKSQDPSFDNRNIYKSGSALLVNTNYSQKGFGVMVQYKWVDNMSFRSDRNESINNVLINNLPAISKNHAYSYSAMYPYATQANGEAGFQIEIFKKFNKGSFIGGKYGTMMSMNFSRITGIDKTPLNDSTKIGQSGTDGYTTSFLSMSDELYYQDANIDITKKFSKKLKGVFTYQNIKYNQKVLEVHLDVVEANIFIADLTWKIKPKHSLRIEAQALFTSQDSIGEGDYREYGKQDYGDWAMLTLEYTISPNWFFAVSDQWNYVSFDDDIAKKTLLYNHNKELDRIHYYSVAMGYTKGPTRVALSYGKQREGILCVGGVCRAVPASNGLLLTLSHTF
ncbi:MAG: hypothetical protein JEZ09_13460 [Salinivirgaceae bacterium]|nr:hypothetical protein [Salinivirgaceae bacterium]